LTGHGEKTRGGFLREHGVPVAGSVGLHAALLLALTFGAGFLSRPHKAAAPPVAIEATVVDEAQVQQEMARLDQQDRQEIIRRQEEERKAREAAEAARRLREQEQQRLQQERRAREQAAREEQARLAELQKQRQEEERLREEERQKRLAEEQKRKEEEQRRMEAERKRQEEEERLAKLEAQEEQRRKAEEERRRKEAEAARQQAQLEADLQRALAAEDERREAEQSGLLDQYINLIANRIEQNWIRPASAKPGLECVVKVAQIPSGDVVDVQVGRCNGDEAVVRSIEAAVLKASPLPKPPTPALFERNLVVLFRPDTN
jgi:colicin import membrane protein